MKEKKVLTKRFAYDYNELDSVAEFLEHKAAEGWELTSKTGVIFGFRKCEPKKVKVSVELVYADKDDSERERFVEYCEASGWKHIFSDGKVQIFETEDLDAEPIHSDPEVKLGLIHKKCRFLRMILPAVLTVVVFVLWKEWILPIEIDDVFSWTAMLPIVGFPFLGILMLVYEVDYLRWYKSAKESAAKGMHPSYRKTPISKISDKAMMIYIFGGLVGTNLLDAIYSGDRTLILICVGIFGAFGLFMFLYTRMSAKNTTDKTGDLPLYIVLVIIFGIVVSSVAIALTATGPADMPKDEELPLLFTDLGMEYEGEVERHISQYGTALGKSTHYSDGWWNPYTDGENWEEERIGYTIYVSQFEKLQNRILQELCLKDTEDYETVDESAFDAKEAYYSKKEEQWLLVYDTQIVELWSTIDLTDIHKKIIGEKLSCEL